MTADPNAVVLAGYGGCAMKASKKYLTISTCEECTYGGQTVGAVDSFEWHWHCEKMGRPIGAQPFFPDWCPLPEPACQP
jgi:hypothetical protein